MKHKHLLTIGLMAAMHAVTANARVAGVSVPGPYPHTPSQSAASGAQIINSRLVAKSYYTYQNGQLTPVDSFRYSFSNGRGGSPDEMDINDDGVLFDESIRYVFSTGNAVNNLKRIQQYGVDDRVEMLYYKPWNQGKVKWDDTFRYVYQYNGNNQIVHARKDIYDGNSWPTSNTYFFSNNYTNSGRLQQISATEQDYWFDYDANDNLICRTLQERSLQAVQWRYTIKDSFAYDGLGRVVYTLHQVYDLNTSSWINDQRVFYTYTGIGGDLDYSLVENWSTGAGWQKKEQHAFAYDGNHNKLSDITKTWNAGQGAYQTARRLMWTYNSYNQVTTLTANTWNNTTGNWVFIAGDYQRSFYYEMYFPTAIKNLDDVVVNMDLFPCPAQDAVHFRIDWRTPQAFSVGVTDMQGRTVQQWDERAVKDYEHTLNVSQWPAGNYLLTVNGENGRATKRIVVAR